MGSIDVLDIVVQRKIPTRIQSVDSHLLNIVCHLGNHILDQCWIESNNSEMKKMEIGCGGLSYVQISGRQDNSINTETGLMGWMTGV